MGGERESLRDLHRLFGLLLTDYFADSPFVDEMERASGEEKGTS